MVDSKLIITIIIKELQVKLIITIFSTLVEIMLMLIETFNSMLMETLTLEVLAITIATMVDFKLIIIITIMEFSVLLIITMFSMLLEVTSILIEISLLMQMET